MADPQQSLGGLREAQKKWRFFPAAENGKAAASSVGIRIPITVR